MTEFEPLARLPVIHERIAQEALAIAARAAEIPLAELISTTRRRASIAFARQVAMYLCHVAAGMSMREIAAAFGRNRTTVSHACHVIEDRRDSPAFSIEIEELEQKLRRRMHSLLVERPEEAASNEW